jgi:uncharacterized phage protein (TIGR01671 family)
MREILFRGKRLDNGEWVEGSLWTWGQNVHIHHIFDFPDGALWFRVDPSTIGQYTGLCDKNGKKIFEGDVIKGRYWLSEDRIYQVLYDENGFYYFIEKGQSCHPDHIDSVEVIGNIHDNPELMKGMEHGKE